jgi:hypothetical protein
MTPESVSVNCASDVSLAVSKTMHIIIVMCHTITRALSSWMGGTDSNSNWLHVRVMDHTTVTRTPGHMTAPKFLLTKHSKMVTVTHIESDLKYRHSDSFVPRNVSTFNPRLNNI